MYEASQLITSVKGEVLRTALPAAHTVGGFLPPTPPLLNQIGSEAEARRNHDLERFYSNG
jgi:hypothetical protein